MKKKNNCANCVYNRNYLLSTGEPVDNWCSNSKSARFLKIIDEWGVCDEFAQKGRKAPLWMRILNKILKGILE